MQYKGNTYGNVTRKNISLVIFMAILLILGLCGCSKGTAKTDNTVPKAPAAETEEATETTVSDNDLKAAGSAVVLHVDEPSQTIVFAAVDTGEEYSLSYNGLTDFTDQYGEVKIPRQFTIGTVVDIVVSVHSGIIQSVQMKPDTFTLENISGYEINQYRGVFSYGGENYRISDATVIVSDGKRGKFRHIKDGDELTVVGYGKDVYVIIRGSGCGYVRLMGQESFKGGWIEIGELITSITDDMLLEVPEGDYEMLISYNRFGGSKKVSVKRGRETIVDVSDLKGELLKNGKIVFTFDPVDAYPNVMIDGVEVDAKRPVEVEYGVHTLDVEAAGYSNIHKLVSVGSPMAYISIELEKSEVSKNSTARTVKKADEDLPESFTANDDKPIEKEDKEKPQEEVKKPEEEKPSEETETETATVRAKLYIDGPDEAEVYLDGSYKGIVPCAFIKVAGTHVITLRQDGHKTKHYTITLSADEDETYSFAELEELDDDEEEEDE